MENSKVGIVWELNTYGGVQTCVIVLIKELNKNGIVPVLFCENKPSEKIKNEFNINFNYEIIRFYRVIQLGIVIYHLLRHVKTSSFKQKVSFLYVFDNDLINNDSKIKIIRYISMPPFYYKSFGFKPLSALKQAAQKLVCMGIPKYNYKNDYKLFINSQYTQNIFIENHGFPIDVVYPPSLMDMSNSFQYEIKIKEKRKVVFFSRICEDKGIDIYLELSKYFLEFDFLLIGSVDPQNTEYYLKLEKQSKEQDNLFIYKNLDNNGIKELISDCDFFIFTREFEHFGIVTLDMIRMGLIPIVHNSGGQKEIVSIENLRFNSFTDLIDKIRWVKGLDSLELSQLRHELRVSIEKFDNSIFLNQFVGALY